MRGAVLQAGGRWRELDLILVGPPGLLSVEVRVWPRDVFLPGDGRAFVRRRGVWEERPCPVRQAESQRELLAAWLRHHGLTVPAGTALLFPNTLAVTGQALAAPDAPFVCWGPEAAAGLGRALRDAPREHLREAELRALVALLTR